jgi:outer membrane receptor protein involved in Fe transport
VVATGVHERLTYSVGHFGYATDGFRDNNDFDSDLRSAFVQYRPTDRHSLQLELRASDIEKGDLRLLFDPNNFNAVLRQHESNDRLRIGTASQVGRNGVLLGAVSYEEGSGFSRAGSEFRVDTDWDESISEISFLSRAGRWQLQTGFSYLERDQQDLSELRITIPFPPFTVDVTETLETQLRQLAAYGYAQYAVTDRIVATFGGSYDALEGQVQLDERQFNPKLGLTWRLGTDTTLRLAALRTLQGPFVSKQNIQPRLEPTQVAGFNQFFFGAEGEEAERYGIGIDHSFSASVHAGAEISARDLQSPVTLVLPDSPIPVASIVPIAESFRRAYAYWMPNERLAAGIEYQYEHIDNRGLVLSDGIAELTTQRLPLRLKVFAPWGFSAGVTATFVDQRGDFGGQFFGTEEPTVPGEDTFWVVDGSLSYRLPNRRGLLALGVYNLFDQEFRFQDTDPESPTIMPERLLAFRFTLAY